MTSVPVYNLDGSVKGEIALPEVFSTPFRPDVIQKVFVLTKSRQHQPQGRDPMAGKRTSAETFNPPTGHGIARVARVKGERHPRAGQAAGIASVVGGRQAHPPTSSKRVWKKVNSKERALAVASAIAATANQELVSLRGHRIADVKSLPIVAADELQDVVKAIDLKAFLIKVGLTEELQRAAQRKKRSGKARIRGRVTKRRRGPLIIVSRAEGIGRVASSLAGVKVVEARNLSVLDLAPGSHPGQLAVWSESALADISKSVLEVAVPLAI